MKKLLLNANICMIAAIFCVACSKDPSNPNAPASATGSIQYKVNGNLVKIDNANLASGEGVGFAKQLKGTAIPATRYLLNAQKGVNNVFILVITTDSLRAINYHYDSAAIANTIAFASFAESYNAEESALFYADDYMDINITSYANSRISGTFTAKFTLLDSVSDYSKKGMTLITEGVINNVPVIY